MKKPTILLIEDFKNDLVELVNASGLPIYTMIEPVKNLYEELIRVNNQELINTKKEWEEAQRKENKNEKNNKK